MEKKDIQSKQQKLQRKTSKYVPNIKYDKVTEEWTMRAKLIETQEEPRITMTKKQLDAIAKIVSYLYHDKQQQYMKSSSELRKMHIYNDLKDKINDVVFKINNIKKIKIEYLEIRNKNNL